MDVIEAIRKRRSIRNFKKDDVSEDILNVLLDCARLAPSAGNCQPWVFFAVKDEGKKRELRIAAGAQPQIEEAPLVIVICANPECSASSYQDRGRSLYVFQDTAAATQNILLAATSYGLATCWVGAFDEGYVRKTLALPFHLRPVSMIPIGYPSCEAENRDLKPLEEVVRRL